MPEEFVSNNDKAFVLKALQEELRIDGRKLYDYRKVKFEFTLDDCTCTVTIGNTRVFTSVQAVLEPPYPDRPNEGSIRFNVEISPMASPAVEMGWQGVRGEEAMELSRLVERGLKQSRAIDTEALCVLAGRKVWSLTVDSHVLDANGNLRDACCLSALGALMAFRKPEVTVGGASGTEVIVHPPEVREPLPLTIHHLPVAVTFGLFEDGNTVIIDPELKEEATMQGSMTLIVNPNREVCAIHKNGGVGISTNQLFRCVRLAMTKSEELVAALKAALELHEVRRVQARIRRHAPGPAQAQAGVPSSAAEAPAAASGPSQAEQQLAAELGISLADDAVDDHMVTSSSSEEEDGAEGQKAVDRQEQGAAGPGPGSGVRPDSGAAAPKAAQLKHAPKIGPGPSSTLLPTPKTKKKVKEGTQDKAKGKRAPELKYDELEEIAAVIAGAGAGGKGSTGADAGQVTNLADAIKQTR